MKNIKINTKIFLLLAVAFTAFTSCTEDEKSPIPPLGNGGFIKFVSAPEFNIGEDPTNAEFNSFVEDPNGNVDTYEITVVSNFDGSPEDPISFRTATTFPFDIGFTGQDMADLFGVDISVFESNNTFGFSATVLTNDGRLYTGDRTEFDAETGEWNGGDTADNASGNDNGQTLLQAFKWTVRFREP